MLRLLICVWLSVLMVWPVVGHADQHESLHGLKGINILVESPNKYTRALGITRQQLRTDVEVKLRSAGIPILSPSRGYLYVNLNGLTLGTMD